MSKIVKPVGPDVTDIYKPARNRTVLDPNSIEAMTPETDKMVTGTFVNIECQGQPAKVCGKYYKGMPYFSKVFQDGEKATIPLSVMRWINERIVHDIHTHILDEKGAPIKSPKPVHRYKFIPDYASV